MATNDYLTVQERYRKKIIDAQLTTRLIKHAKGELLKPMDASQVQVALKLLGKVMPDLSAIAMQVDHSAGAMSRVELEGRLAAFGRDPHEVWQMLEKRHDIQALADESSKSNATVTLDKDTHAIDIVDESESEAGPVD